MGEKLIEAAESYIIENGGKQCMLSAQVRVSEFYRKLGYLECGSVYLDEDCPHIMMKKTFMP